MCFAVRIYTILRSIDGSIDRSIHRSVERSIEISTTAESDHSTILSVPVVRGGSLLFFSAESATKPSHRVSQSVSQSITQLFSRPLTHSPTRSPTNSLSHPLSQCVCAKDTEEERGTEAETANSGSHYVSQQKKTARYPRSNCNTHAVARAHTQTYTFTLSPAARPCTRRVARRHERRRPCRTSCVSILQLPRAFACLSCRTFA